MPPWPRPGPGVAGFKDLRQRTVIHLAPAQLGDGLPDAKDSMQGGVNKYSRTHGKGPAHILRGAEGLVGGVLAEELPPLLLELAGMSPDLGEVSLAGGATSMEDRVQVPLRFLLFWSSVSCRGSHNLQPGIQRL